MISRWLDEWLGRCPSCGFKAKAICARCRNILNETLLRDVSGERLFSDSPEVLTLFDRRFLYRWDENRPPSARVLRDVILSSKGRTSDAIVDFWVGEFLRRATVGGDLSRKRNWLVLAPPSKRRESELDHAGRLAAGLAMAVGPTLRFEDGVLEQVKDRGFFVSQKSKSKGDRAKIEFKIAPHLKQAVERAEGFLLMDDVLASGATANAAWKALGRPRAFEVWAIAYRAKLKLMGSDAKIER